MRSNTISLSGFFDKYKAIVIAVFFLVFFAVDISIFFDYGVLWDEFKQRRLGVGMYNYMKERGELHYPYRNKFYGPLFAITCAFVEDMFKITDLRQLILSRHLMVFLSFFLGVFFFFLLVKRRFGSWKWGLLGSVFLILSPRIFAEGFYNPKDIPLMTAFIMAMYSMIFFLDKPGLSRVLLHSFLTAVLIATRVIGLLVPALTVILLAVSCAVNRTEKKQAAEYVLYILIYAVFTSGFTYLFWPVLWQDPIGNFIKAVKWVGEFNWYDSFALYAGVTHRAYDVPWHYTLVWMLITIPPVYLITFVPGFIGGIFSLFKKHIPFSAKEIDIVCAAWLVLPIFGSIVLKTCLFHGWRHHYFVYPPFLMFSLLGVRGVSNILKAYVPSDYKTVSVRVWSGIVALSLLVILAVLVRYHPYQHVYFNSFIGGLKGAQYKFELDYSGISYKKALEYIAARDPAPIIPVAADDMVGRFNGYILPEKDRSRLLITQNPAQSRYFVGTYRDRTSGYFYDNEIYSNIVDGVKITTVYRLEGKKE